MMYNWKNINPVTKPHKNVTDFCHLELNRHYSINEPFKRFKTVTRNLKVLLNWFTMNSNERFYARSLSIKYSISQENDKQRYMLGIMIKGRDL